MPSLPQPLFDAIAKQILPYVQNEGERRTWLTAPLNQDPVFQRINWSGPAQPFAVHVVETLSHDQLVNALRRLFAGAEQGPNIESLCDQIAALKPAPDPAEAHNPFYADSREPLGKEEEIRRIRAKLSAGNHCSIVGPPGSGKSLLLTAIQRNIPSWLGCAPQAVLLIHFRDITGLKELQEQIVHHLGGSRASELRSLLRHKPLRLLILDDLGGMDSGERGLKMRRWLRGLDDSAGTKLLMGSNERLNVLFRKDDPSRDSPLAGLDPSPIELGPLSIESCRRLIALRLEGAGLDSASFSDLFQSPRQPRDLLHAAAARYEALAKPRR